MKNGITTLELAERLEKQLQTKKDFIVKPEGLSIFTDVSDGSFVCLGKAGDFHMTDYFHDQVSSKLGIPREYYTKMRGNSPHLLDQNINHWLHRMPENRLIRTIDGQARAFLSDKYRPLDNYDLAMVVLPVIAEFNCKIVSCELTERRMYIKCLNEKVTAEVAVGDVVQAGIVISNSEVGCGTVRVEPLLYRLSCKNGMIANDFAMKKFHIGRSGDEFEQESVSVFFKDETRQADDKAFWMKVKDIVRGSLTDVTFNQIVDKIKVSQGIKIEGDLVKVVEVVSKKHGLVESEKSNVLKFLTEGGDLSLWGMVNAITRTSQEVDDYDRATELERLGGVVLERPELIRL